MDDDLLQLQHLALSWHLTTPYQVKEKATLFTILPKSAFKMRKRFLVEELGKWPGYIEGEHDEPPYGSIWAILDEIQALTKVEQYKPHKGDIDDEMIERARNYPVDQLITFKNGKTHCFAHVDKSPSMFFGFRKNIAVCPVCNKAWNAISILVDRDGLNFKEAVKDLCSR